MGFASPRHTRNALRVLLLTAGILGVVAGHASALEVILYNRKRFVGSVRMSPKTVFVKVGRTTYKIPRGSVRAVRLHGEEVFECQKRKAVMPKTPKAHYELAKWLEERFQHEEAEKYYESTIRLDPNHKKARRALGYRRDKGEWVRSELDQLRVRSNWLGMSGAEACCGLARHYLKLEQHPRVEQWLRRALIAHPEHAGALKLIRPITDRYVSRNTYRLPVDGLWAVVVDRTGHHKREAYMVYALDFVKVDEQFRSNRVQGSRKLDDYYTFGAPIHAAANGQVYSVNEGFDDLPIGRWGEFRSANTVCISHGNGEYTVYGHLQKGSIAVKKGQKVQAGQVIAKAGNSGSSGFPHMHFAMYDRDGISYPVTFVKYREVTGDGETPVKSGKLSEGKFYRNALTPAGESKTP